MRRPDLTVLAIPAFVGAMGAELWWQRRNPAAPGTSRAGDYELGDTIASLTMGVGSLVAPFVAGPVVRRLAPGPDQLLERTPRAQVTAEGLPRRRDGQVFERSMSFDPIMM